MTTKSPIRTWAQFDRAVRYSDTSLLQHLPEYADAVLVAGCQRSGTTAVTRVLRAALNTSYPILTKDDELDAALILCGAEEYVATGRCCFQTTFINDRVVEYFEHADYSLIWILRNPQAVVRSMLYNWRRGALNRLFRACGQNALDPAGRKRFDRLGTLGFSRLQKACLSYRVKTAQVHDIADKLGQDRLYIVDYDDLLQNNREELPALFRFAKVPFDDRFLKLISPRKSSRRGQLNDKMKLQISEMCDGEYDRARELALSWKSTSGN